jgi:hypothetical protein
MNKIIIHLASAILVVALAATLAACGRGSKKAASQGGSQLSDKAASVVAVQPLNDAGHADSSLTNPFRVAEVERAKGGAQYAVFSSASYGTHVYVQVTYDASRMTPSSVTYGGALGDASKVLFLAITTKPGMIPIGVMEAAPNACSVGS